MAGPRRDGRAPPPAGAAVLAALAACSSRPDPVPPRQVIDVHTHIAPGAFERAIELMDRHGIDVAVNLSGGFPGAGLEPLLAEAARFPGRFVTFANLDWRLARTGAGYGVAMAAQLERAHELGARGLKIPKALGLGYSDAAGALIAVDSPELDPVFEAAGRLGMPVALHTGDPVAFWQPATPDNERYAELEAHPGWSFYGAGVPSWESLFRAYERRVARHPGTTFIGVHFGNAPEDPARVAAMLDRYPNLYVDTAARIPELGRHDPAAMRALLVTHADRVLFGTDLGVGPRAGQLMFGSTGRAPPTADDEGRFFTTTWRYFETNDRQFAHPTPIQGSWSIDGVGLPRDVRERIYAGNARRLLGSLPETAQEPAGENELD